MQPDPKNDGKYEKIREPAIWLRRVATAHSASKLGGLPSLPSADLWPRHGVTGEPLHFLAQIDLSALPKTPLAGGKSKHQLPESGILFFFADIEEEMLWGFDERGTNHDATRVIFAPQAGAPVAAPEGLPEINHSFGSDVGYKPSGLRVYPEPPLQAFAVDVYATGGEEWDGAWEESDLRLLRSIERVAGPAPEFRGPQGWTDFWAAPIGLYHGDGYVDTHVARHQMLGPPIDVQNTAEEARESGWVPLFQIDTDRGLHKDFMFCDMGMAQFWIKPEDLKARRFDRAWATTEGG